MNYNHKITILFFIFLIHCSTSIAQKATPVLFSQKDSLYIKNNIIAVLDRLKDAQNTTFIHSVHILDVQGLSEVNRKRYPQLWNKQLQEKIKLSLHIINTLGNYMDFEYASKIKRHHQPPTPPCWIEETIEGIRIARTPSEDEIRDEVCKIAFLKQKKEYLEVLALIEYQRPLHLECQQVIRNLELIFEWSSYTSLNEFDAFIRPYEYLLDSETKQRHFRSFVNSALESYTNREKSKQ